MSQLVVKYEDVTLLTEDIEDINFDIDLVKLKQPTFSADGSNFTISIPNNSLEEATLVVNKFLAYRLKYKV